MDRFIRPQAMTKTLASSFRRRPMNSGAAAASGCSRSII